MGRSIGQAEQLLRAVRIAGAGGTTLSDLDRNVRMSRERRNRLLVALSGEDLIRSLRGRIYALPPIDDEPGAIYRAVRRTGR